MARDLLVLLRGEHAHEERDGDRYCRRTFPTSPTLIPIQDKPRQTAARTVLIIFTDAAREDDHVHAL